MAKKTSIYTQLSRPVSGLGARYSLWLAPDHLMQVESMGYKERYQRFRFAETQAFLITSSRRRLYWMLVWMTPWLISGVTLLVGSNDGYNVYVAGIVCGLTSIPLLINWLLGPTCRVYIVTRVQTARLAAFVRRRKADKLLARLRPLIEDAQALPTPLATAPTEPNPPTAT